MADDRPTSGASNREWTVIPYKVKGDVDIAVPLRLSYHSSCLDLDLERFS